MYRQVTLTALVDRLSGTGDPDPQAREVAYDDIRAAWQHYLANDNDGRGVVLVGHSQGASLLNRLIAAKIEDDPDQLDLLVAAYLAGSSMQVPAGKLVGGDFQAVPLCESTTQFGCALTWVSFRSTAPPPADALFGDRGSGTEAACTNPAALDGGAADLVARFPADPRCLDPADARADDIGGDLTPQWGLHLVDVNLVMGDLQRLVATQGAAWAASR